MLLILEIISSLLIIAGTTFMLIASIGIIRLPDFYIRMSAITKAGTLGIGLILTGIGLYFNMIEMSSKVAAIIFFLLITSPVSAHIIARAAFIDRVPFWENTIINEFKSYLDKHKSSSEKDKSEDEL